MAKVLATIWLEINGAGAASPELRMIPPARSLQVQYNSSMSGTLDEAAAAAADRTAPANPRRRVVLATLIGTTIEFYDFYVYATAAALVFPHLFFPGADPTASLLASFREPERGASFREPMRIDVCLCALMRLGDHTLPAQLGHDIRPDVLPILCATVISPHFVVPPSIGRTVPQAAPLLDCAAPGRKRAAGRAGSAEPQESNVGAFPHPDLDDQVIRR